MENAYGIHWFRRDLRIAGNPALKWNHSAHQGRVLGLFCLDPAIRERDDFSPARYCFFLESLAALSRDLRARGGELLVLEGGPELAFERLLHLLREKKRPLPRAVSFNRDYEPFARKRDSAVTKLLSRTHGLEVRTERDHLLIEPQELHKPGDPESFYQVFTPFHKTWLRLLGTPQIRERLDRDTALKNPLRFRFTRADLWGRKPAIEDMLMPALSQAQRACPVPLPEAGEKAAHARILSFVESGVAKYETLRDFPAVDGTSRISPYLKTGSLTTAQVVAILAAAGKLKYDASARKFLSELVWREFYYHILHHRPDVENGPFQLKYKTLRWENSASFFKAWKEGRTGYPIIDAGMRQLQETGWMHNRLRMITASFLTKDLLIDWRWGARHFMRHLVDGDLAANNGGWQWAASTGCDAQPYFRIFNPTLQGKRYDPEGAYVRRWLPELQAVKHRKIHLPRSPIVDHASRAIRALSLFRPLK